MLEPVRRVAELVKCVGGRALLVGGSVRDILRGEKPVDFDIEVYGLTQAKVIETLKPHYPLDLVGASFGVIKLHGLNIDVALPRRETKLGLGHKAFETDFDPNLSLAEAAARRDFTINAIYLDPLTSVNRRISRPMARQERSRTARFETRLFPFRRGPLARFACHAIPRPL